MASNVRIKINTAGVWEMLRSPEIQGILQERARGIVERAGPGFETDTHVGPHRANVAVKASTKDAVRECLDNNRLLKSLR